MSSALLATSFTSCRNEEEDIWSESSIERLQQVQVEYADVLTSAKNGWEMQYFPTVSEPGYIMAVKFNTNGSVEVAANNRWTNNVYTKSAPSTWGINIDNGPVLSFNSYNSILHIFSDPKPIEGTSYGTGLGMEGDYEFIMIDVPEDGIVVLKGKKRGTYAYLRRIPEGTDWAEYLGAIKSKQEIMVADNPSPMLLTVGDKQYNMWYKKADNVLNIVPVGGDTITQEQLFHYTFNSRGLYLLEQFNLDGADNLQWFYSDQAEGQDWTAMTKMIGKDNIDGETIDGVTITAGDPFRFFNEQLDASYENGPSLSNWKIALTEAGMSAENLAKFKALDDALATTFTARNYLFTADYSTVGTALQVTLKRTGQPTAYIMFGLDRNQGTDSDVLNAQRNDDGTYKYSVTAGYEAFFKNFMSQNSAVVDNFMSMFNNADFSIGFDSYLTLRTVKMADKQNQNSWFVVESSYVRR